MESKRKKTRPMTQVRQTSHLHATAHAFLFSFGAAGMPKQPDVGVTEPCCRDTREVQLTQRHGSGRDGGLRAGLYVGLHAFVYQGLSPPHPIPPPHPFHPSLPRCSARLLDLSSLSISVSVSITRSLSLGQRSRKEWRENDTSRPPCCGGVWRRAIVTQFVSVLLVWVC